MFDFNLNDDGNKILHFAIHYLSGNLDKQQALNHINIIKILSQKGASWLLKNNEGHTPLHCCSSKIITSISNVIITYSDHSIEHKTLMSLFRDDLFKSDDKKDIEQFSVYLQDEEKEEVLNIIKQLSKEIENIIFLNS